MFFFSPITCIILPKTGCFLHKTTFGIESLGCWGCFVSRISQQPKCGLYFLSVLYARGEIFFSLPELSRRPRPSGRSGGDEIGPTRMGPWYRPSRFRRWPQLDIADVAR
jgi:hypothetical protein